MKKFDIKRMYGYYWMIISFIVPLICFIIFFSFTIYLKINYDRVPNKDNANFVFIVLTCVDIFIALLCVGKLAYYLFFLLPFKNSKGKIVTIKITKRSIFDTMNGIIETEKGANQVKVIFMSYRFQFLNDFKIGDHANCFIREKDLSNPKFVVLYR